jgi:hypothetical protein
MEATPAPTQPKNRRTWSSWSWSVRISIVVGSLVVVALAGVLGTAFWFDVTATQVTFIDDIGRKVVIPDCGTDIAQLDAGARVKLPIPADHSADCSIISAKLGRVIGCLKVPVNNKSTVIRLSDNRPPPCH